MLWHSTYEYLIPIHLYIVEAICIIIKLQEYPIPAAATAPSQKPSHGNISVTKRGIIDALVSKELEKSSE